MPESYPAPKVWGDEWIYGRSMTAILLCWLS